ncbi:hypothetical protein AHAS_Ahas07G0111800 [Arachis hypogaea]
MLVGVTMTDTVENSFNREGNASRGMGMHLSILRLKETSEKLTMASSVKRGKEVYALTVDYLDILPRIAVRGRIKMWAGISNQAWCLLWMYVLRWGRILR